ncbi:hypothetical protein AMIS_47010 [Actinoplanes missouriensis 431]|uniref:Uncharacterized protein n=1 Tax=Actinoplanes missouriensis (strain ATCC 14538 / DSM 43046 / CBS 188.64 / JCM 3121 / NBRC 102363 / NCIMB 12654 / NRRL B-3342 / UNCC 431) TaxID=512565 RepID=I0HA84_ACTM4|nr:hypothetical protein [Actinoplanes missouriensis]BAL89921.1 hypothetical protein AMIS_47010 [Actinoplanes missouriensis 431]
MNDVAQVNTTQPADWAPSAEQTQRAELNRPYPPHGRTAPRPAPVAMSRD